MKKLFVVMLVATLFSCEEAVYKKVVDVSYTTYTYKQTVSTSKNNTLNNAAGGALLGGTVSYILGGSIAEGAVIGGTAGAALSDGTTEHLTHERLVVDVNYVVKFDDGSEWKSTNWNPYSVGDSIRVRK